MFDILIREVAARFGVGDKALPLLQVLLAYMTSKENGGLIGFLEKFKAAGFGPVVQSWLGGGPAAQPISNSQLETVLGSSGGLLSQLTSRLGLERESAASSLGYLIPVLVGKLTPGGSIPSSLSAEVSALAEAGQSLLAAPVAASVSDASGGGGWMKWLPWAIVAIAALVGLNYCSRSNNVETPPATAPAPASSGPVVGAFGPGPAVEPASAPAQSGNEPAAAPGAAASSAAEPTGSGVVSWTSDSAPALKVYFDSGSAELSGEFAAKVGELLNYLKENVAAKAVISGYNDSTGDPEKNAELSKRRAEAVQNALVAAGVPKERTLLEKPADTTGTASTASASRRVEVVVRR